MAAALNVMIDRTEARRIVADHLGEGDLSQEGFTPVILDEETLERTFGWVFFYQSQEYLTTGDFRLMLGGNAPLIVDREDGSLHVTGTAEPVENYVARYERAKTV